jgi:hypothetical protein
MIRKILSAAAIALIFGAYIAPTLAATATATVTVTVKPPLTLTVTPTPANPTVRCDAAPGTVVSVIKVATSDGTTFTGQLSMSGAVEFALVGSNVVVNSIGTALKDDCASIPAGGSITKAVSVTATQ